MPVPVESTPARFWSTLQLLLCLILTGGVLAHLLTAPDHLVHPRADRHRPAPASQLVRLVGARSIGVSPGTPLARRLEVVTVQPTRIRSPILSAAGTVIASLRPGSGRGSDHWQFSSSELLTVFADWQKATSDISFADTQLVAIRQLADTRIDAQQKLVDRMKKLVEAGTDAAKDLVAAQAELIQLRIQGRKDVHEAGTAARVARKTEAVLARQLQQSGLEPEMLQPGSSDLDIVMADVPEGFISRVRLGQGCEAHFFGLPDQSFSGKVRAISPVLSRERRSLRVLFTIVDPQDQLRPGMFADIGLGTDARDALLIPAEGLIHVGRADYLLVPESGGVFRMTEVQVSELPDGRVEVLSGLRPADRVVGHGAILLKPQVIQALQEHGPARGGRS